MVGEGEGEGVACAASLEDGDFGSSELCGLSLSASSDSVDPVGVSPKTRRWISACSPFVTLTESRISNLFLFHLRFGSGRAFRSSFG